VANKVSNSVSVLLNSVIFSATAPAFTAQQTFATGATPYSVAVADVNGDGKPDLLVANKLSSNVSSNVSVLLNMTAPGAATPESAAQNTFAVGASLRSVAAADVNGDGKPDLLVANYFSHTVGVLLNMTQPGATTPVFATQQTFASTFPRFVAAADVNGDG